MNSLLHIKSDNIVPVALTVAISFLFTLLFYFEIRLLDRVILPFLVTVFISFVIYYILNRFFKDKFISKIFLISILLHFVFILFWQLFKYYGLGLQMPTENIFEGYVSDVDGIEYHALGVDVSKYLQTRHLGIFYKKMYGGFFPKLIGIIYHITGTHNPFLICCINSLCAGLIAPIIYYMGKVTLKDISLAKLYSLFFIITFSHIMNTSTMMRDVYITLFIYLSIFLSYQFYKTRNPIFLITALFSLHCLRLFRPYACYIVFIAIIAAYIFHNIRITKQKSSIKVNRITMALIVLSPVLAVLSCYLFIKLTHSFGVIGSVEDLIHVRDTAYVGSNTDYDWNFAEMYSIFPPLPFIVGTFCLFFAPFPWEWVLARRIIYVPDMIMLYCFLSSFFKNLKLVFKEKNFILTVSLLVLLFQFSIYCVTLGNSGSIHRLRGPFLPMIYLIAMYRPDKFLTKILNHIQKWRLL